ncbi:c-type cytochrome [Methylobacterium nonmethylotrophicum]|uniref:C-type cytochrome n=1 Tax=Methylobacterium nonmethylotrophicum TaxID=1141884 RepID=A0A4Z0NP30_9HYPH|nr:c-type cytochrome [Methylobacterium nonmethylotrophicum]TGD97968.1 c-type cytochrome [Methylobacterium nonmethylotrophicum]
MRRFPFGLMVLAGLAGPARAGPLGERLEPCLGCHGEGGRSETPGVPSLGGQPADYLVTQLYQFREDQRTAPPMNAMAKDLSDDDLRAFAEALSALPAPSPRGDALDPGLVARARALVGRHQCNSCHGADLAGRDAIPRLRGQREEYLAAALTGYRTNARPGYDPAMNEVAQGLNEADIADLAAFLSHQ